MADPAPLIAEALSSLGSMLEADGYALELSAELPSTLVARIVAGPIACQDCLVPKAIMRHYFEDALRPVCDLGIPDIHLVYPGEDD